MHNKTKAKEEDNDEDAKKDQIFLEIRIDRKAFEDLSYPNITVDFVPGFTFRPMSRYQ